MKDIMLFGAGHDGTKRQIEPGREVIYAISKPDPTSSARSLICCRSAQVPFSVSTVYEEKGGFLVGVFGDEPTDEQILKAIDKYDPQPIA